MDSRPSQLGIKRATVKELLTTTTSWSTATQGQQIDIEVTPLTSYDASSRQEPQFSRLSRPSRRRQAESAHSRRSAASNTVEADRGYQLGHCNLDQGYRLTHYDPDRVRNSIENHPPSQTTAGDRPREGSKQTSPSRRYNHGGAQLRGWRESVDVATRVSSRHSDAVQSRGGYGGIEEYDTRVEEVPRVKQELKSGSLTRRSRAPTKQQKARSRNGSPNRHNSFGRHQKSYRFSPVQPTPDLEVLLTKSQPRMSVAPSIENAHGLDTHHGGSYVADSYRKTTATPRMSNRRTVDPAWNAAIDVGSSHLSNGHHPRMPSPRPNYGWAKIDMNEGIRAFEAVNMSANMISQPSSPAVSLLRSPRLMNKINITDGLKASRRQSLPHPIPSFRPTATALSASPTPHSAIPIYDKATRNWSQTPDRASSIGSESSASPALGANPRVHAKLYSTGGSTTPAPDPKSAPLQASGIQRDLNLHIDSDRRDSGHQLEVAGSKSGERPASELVHSSGFIDLDEAESDEDETLEQSIARRRSQEKANFKSKHVEVVNGHVEHAVPTPETMGDRLPSASAGSVDRSREASTQRQTLASSPGLANGAPISLRASEERKRSNQSPVLISPGRATPKKRAKTATGTDIIKNVNPLLWSEEEKKKRRLASKREARRKKKQADALKAQKEEYFIRNHTGPFALCAAGDGGYKAATSSSLPRDASVVGQGLTGVASAPSSRIRPSPSPGLLSVGDTPSEKELGKTLQRAINRINQQKAIRTPDPSPSPSAEKERPTSKAAATKTGGVEHDRSQPAPNLVSNGSAANAVPDLVSQQGSPHVPVAAPGQLIGSYAEPGDSEEDEENGDDHWQSNNVIPIKPVQSKPIQSTLVQSKPVQSQPVLSTPALPDLPSVRLASAPVVTNGETHVDEAGDISPSRDQGLMPQISNVSSKTVYPDPVRSPSPELEPFYRYHVIRTASRPNDRPATSMVAINCGTYDDLPTADEHARRELYRQHLSASADYDCHLGPFDEIVVSRSPEDGMKTWRGESETLGDVTVTVSRQLCLAPFDPNRQRKPTWLPATVYTVFEGSDATRGSTGRKQVSLHTTREGANQAAHDGLCKWISRIHPAGNAGRAGEAESEVQQMLNGAFKQCRMQLQALEAAREGLFEMGIQLTVGDEEEDGGWYFWVEESKLEGPRN